MSNEFIDVINLSRGHKVQVNLHRGQHRAMASNRRIVAVIAGSQSGKTSFGPHWLCREIQRVGPGDYMVVTPSFPLLELKALPEFRNWFEDILHLGEYKGSPVRKFTVSEFGQQKLFGDYGFQYRTKIFFGYAADPESLESATAKAAWLDEAGQRKFKLASYEAIMRRLALARGRILITTTPYNLGWLKQQIWDKWKEGHPDIDVVRFESIENPIFSREEWDSARGRLPSWKFDMFYRAIFTRPAGLIYENFNPEKHKCPRFAIPDHWQRYLGIDFGGVNTAGVFYAEDPETRILYAYREYHSGFRSARDHVQALLRGEATNLFCVGGSASEHQWRREFRQAGLSIRAPSVTSVEVGIDRVFEAHNQDRIRVFDDLTGYLDEKLSYGRKLNENGEPTEEIEDKSNYHFMDAERYIMSWLIAGHKKAISRQG